MKKNISILSLFGEKNIIKTLSRYIEVRLELVKLEIQEKITDTIITLFEVGMIIAFLGSFFIFANIALGFLLSLIFKSYFIGFSLIALLQLLILFVIWFNRKALSLRFEKNIMKVLYPEESEQESK